MKTFLLALPLLVLAAGPAHATGGLACRTAGADPIQVSLVIGHTAVASVVGARLSHNGRDVAVKVAQSWLDPAEFRLDLTDPNALRHELRIRAKANGRYYDGSLWRHGKRRWVRCREA
ncbi:MAG TPA: hypothetical protein VHN55_09460 [Sphingomicrobium sp.]|nr:hypothetical protein [Sphingomicrobium sp.]